MQLSEFVQILYPYLAGGSRPYEFLRELLDYITDGNEGNNLNAVYDMTPDYLNRIYRSSENLAKTKAAALLSHLDKLRFSGYVNDRLTIDATDELRIKLSSTGVTTPDTSVMCAEVFTKILNEIAAPAKKKSTRDSASQLLRSDKSQVPGKSDTIAGEGVFSCFEFSNQGLSE